MKTIYAFVVAVALTLLALAQAQAAQAPVSAYPTIICDTGEGHAGMRIVNNSNIARKVTYRASYQSTSTGAFGTSKTIGLRPGQTRTVKLDFPSSVKLDFRVWRGSKIADSTLVRRHVYSC